MLTKSSSVDGVVFLWKPYRTRTERRSITIVREGLRAMVLNLLTLRGWLGTAFSPSTGTALLLLLSVMIPLLL
jgi:hypothetical protein